MIKYWVLNSLKKKIIRSRHITCVLLQQKSPNGVDKMGQNEINWFTNELKEHDDKLAAIDLLMKEL